MKTDDPAIKWLEQPELGWAGKMYLPLFAQGLSTTFRHLAKSVTGHVVTTSYPEEEPKIGNPLIYRIGNTGKVLFEDDLPRWYIAVGER